MAVIKSFLRNNADFAARYAGAGQTAIPSKHIAVVTCMDARIDPFAVLGLGFGEAHVIRNAGGIVTDDVLRSLAISQGVLETREIMLIHHTGCGMLQASDAELEEPIRAAAGALPPFPLRTFSDLEAEVRRSVARLRASPYLAHRDAIRGFIYDVDTGKLREVSGD